MPIQNHMYNKIVRKTQGKLLDESRHREHLRQVANRYFSLCYDMEVRKKSIDTFSEKIAANKACGVEDKEMIQARNTAYEQIRNVLKKKKLTEAIIENIIKTQDDVRIFREEARGVCEKKDKDLFFYELNKLFLHGALFGVALWCVSACITIISTEFRHSFNIGAFAMKVFSMLPFTVLISTGVSFLYHIGKYSRTADVMEKIYEDVSDFVNYAESTRSRAGKL